MFCNNADPICIITREKKTSFIKMNNKDSIQMGELLSLVPQSWATHSFKQTVSTKLFYPKSAVWADWPSIQAVVVV